MAKKIFVAATGQHCGKTTMSLSIMHLLKSRYDKVGFIKPVGQEHLGYKGVEMDKDAALMAEIFDYPEEDLPYLSPVLIKSGVTQDYIEGKIATRELGDLILKSLKFLESKYDYLVVEGTGHGGVGSVVGLSNARVAKLMDAPVVMVTPAGVGSVIDRVRLNLALYEKEQAEVRAIIFNKIKADKREKIHSLLKLALGGGEGLKVLAGYNFKRSLADPTFEQLADALKATVIGTDEQKKRIVHNTQIGAASTHRVVDLVKDSAILVAPKTRDELITSMASLYRFPEYRGNLVGMILTGLMPMHGVTASILKSSELPHFEIDMASVDVLDIIRDYTSKLSAREPEKLALVKTMSEDHFALDMIEPLFS